VAGYVVDDITNMNLPMPTARATASVAGSASHVAIAATNDEVAVALGGTIYRLDPVTLATRDSFIWDMDVEALTILDDGSLVIVGTRRMTMVSPDHELAAERADLGDIAEVTHLISVSM
jgi:hypothetical protein